MGQLRTANKRRNRALTALVAAKSAKVATPAKAATAKPPKKHASI